MNKRLNNAIERLLLDDRFLRRFRRNPERALEPFDMYDAEIEAVLKTERWNQTGSPQILPEGWKIG